MGVIQNSVNQLLGTAALATKFSPAIQNKLDIKQTESMANSLNSRSVQLSDISEELVKSGEITQEEADKAYNEIDESLAKKSYAANVKLMGLNPTNENAKQLLYNKIYLQQLQQKKDMALGRRDELIQAGQDIGKTFSETKDKIFFGKEEIKDPALLAKIQQYDKEKK